MYCFQQNDYTQRRMSDPSQALNSFMSRVVKKSRSETENVDALGSATEVEAGTLENGEFLLPYVVRCDSRCRNQIYC